MKIQNNSFKSYILLFAVFDLLFFVRKSEAWSLFFNTINLLTTLTRSVYHAEREQSVSH
jgi:hypothetical protein